MIFNIIFLVEYVTQKIFLRISKQKQVNNLKKRKNNE